MPKDKTRLCPSMTRLPDGPVRGYSLLLLSRSGVGPEERSVGRQCALLSVPGTHEILVNGDRGCRVSQASNGIIAARLPRKVSRLNVCQIS